MNALFTPPDVEPCFTLPAPERSPAPTYIALVFGLCIGVLISAGITISNPAPAFRCAYQVAEVSP